MFKRILFIMVISIVFSFSQSFAGTINMGYGNGAYIPEVYWQGASESTGAGEFIVSGDLQSPAYCINYGVDAGIGSGFQATPISALDYFDTNYSDKTPEKTSAQYAVWLMDRYSVGLGFNPTTIDSSYTHDEAAAALQLAIWDAIYDFNGTAFDVSTDIFQYSVTTGHITELYNYFKNSLVSNYDINDVNAIADEYKAVYVLDGSDIKQTILVHVPVPEPASMLLFGFGLLGLGAIGRRKS